MMKKIIFITVMLLLPIMAQGQGYGHFGGSYKIVNDTSLSIDKTLGKLYLYTGDSTLYMGGGSYLDQLIKLNNLEVVTDLAISGNVSGDLEVSGTITGSQINATGATGTSFYGETPNTTDAVVHLKRTDGPEVKFGASGTNGYVGTTTGHALIFRTNNIDRFGVNATGTALNPITRGSLYLGSEDLGYRGLFVDGKKSTTNLAEFGNDNDGTMGDSSMYIDKLGSPVLANNRWIMWKNTAGTPTNVFKLSNGNAVTFNAAVSYILPDAGNALDFGSNVLRYKNFYTTNMYVSDGTDKYYWTSSGDKAILKNDANVDLVTVDSTANLTVNGSINYGSDNGSTDTYAVTIGGITVYRTGLIIVFRANTVNTGVCTLNVNSLGAKTIMSQHDQTPENGYIEAGSIVMVVYDGTVFQLLTPSAYVGP